ncbi:chorismate-binding protein [Demequina litorisediminis]|uniref:chorismate-binding protein n=1 Tax=Demequina litorisediminis TaxID=1849022 RepID=UPI003D67563C
MLAGTIRPTGDETADLAHAAALARSSKDREEHEYAVRSVRDVLEAHCGSVNVPEEPSVLHLPNVMHLATDVTGVLSHNASALELIRELHPSAAVCGTPTLTAARVIDELEGLDRARYAGPVGWINAAGDGEWCIGLRSAEISADDPTRLRLFAGCGIVAASEAGAEWAESEAARAHAPRARPDVTPAGPSLEPALRALLGGVLLEHSCRGNEVLARGLGNRLHVAGEVEARERLDLLLGEVRVVGVGDVDTLRDRFLEVLHGSGHGVQRCDDRVASIGHLAVDVEASQRRARLIERRERTVDVARIHAVRGHPEVPDLVVLRTEVARVGTGASISAGGAVVTRVRVGGRLPRIGLLLLLGRRGGRRGTRRRRAGGVHLIAAVP